MLSLGLIGQPCKRETISLGRDVIHHILAQIHLQHLVEKGHLRRIWSTDSSYALQRTHLEGSSKLIFLNLSTMRIFFLVANQAKTPTFGLSLLLLCENFLSCGLPS